MEQIAQKFKTQKLYELYAVVAERVHHTRNCHQGISKRLLTHFESDMIGVDVRQLKLFGRKNYICVSALTLTLRELH